MKVLQINNVYDFGSTGKLTRDIHQGLMKRGYDSVVYYGRRYKTKDKNVHKVCSELYGKFQNGMYRLTGIKYGGCLLSTNRIIKAISVEKPDVVHLQCLNGHFVNIYRLVHYLKKNQIPTVLTLHAEFMFTGGCSYAMECNQWESSDGCGMGKCPVYKTELLSVFGDKSSKMWEKMYQAFSGFEKLVVVSVSPWLMNRAKKSGILAGKEHMVIKNGIDTEIFHSFSPKRINDLREKNGFSDSDKIVFHVTRFFDCNIHNIKGGRFILDIARKMKDVKFLIAGDFDHSINYPDNVIMLGNILDKRQLAIYYALSDLTVLVSKRETFSMVCAESLCCGTPVVGFRAGGPEMISIPQYSDFCDYADVSALSDLIAQRLQEKKDPIISSKAISEYNTNRMIDEYLDLYQSLMNTIK